MRTISLELLRHGPPHNQLLSPLTPYLALCENHPPVTFNVPFEHNQFLHRLSALTYELNEKQRQFQLGDTGRALGRLLSNIPGLTAELSRGPGGQASPVLHLRLVLSAAELALLPFELALAENGFPGAGQPLLLQSELPVCLTREVRRVTQTHLKWSSRARVLFAYASPRQFDALPVEAHLLALRRAVAPWVEYFEPDNDESRREKVDKCLHVLPCATIHDIQQACAAGEFTHVHILAHGVSKQVGFDLRFGLALHDRDDPDGEPDVVSGERLATALRPIQHPDRNGLVQPMVVTLASCNLGNVGSVVGVGASVAHALQDAGIPLVVAGQFPLTSGGSVQLVELMYEGILWGADPREMLMDLRRRLHTDWPESHDWAALTAYAALPADFEDQLSQVQVARARSAVDTAMDFADRVTKLYTDYNLEKDAGQQNGNAVTTLENTVPAFAPAPPPSGTARPALPAQADSQVLKNANEKIELAKGRLEALAQNLPERYHSEIFGLLGSSNKRHAEIRIWVYWLNKNPKESVNYAKDAKRILQKARSFYWKSFRCRPDQAWAVVQYIALTVVLNGWSVENENEPVLDPEGGWPGRSLAELWSLAHTLSLNDLNSTPERVGWALGNLVELCVLAMSPGINISENNRVFREWASLSQNYLNRMLASHKENSFQIYSTRRQLERYGGWYYYVTKNVSKSMANHIYGLVQSIPRR